MFDRETQIDIIWRHTQDYAGCRRLVAAWHNVFNVAITAATSHASTAARTDAQKTGFVQVYCHCKIVELLINHLPEHEVTPDVEQVAQLCKVGQGLYAQPGMANLRQQPELVSLISGHAWQYVFVRGALHHVPIDPPVRSVWRRLGGYPKVDPDQWAVQEVLRADSCSFSQRTGV